MISDEEAERRRRSATFVGGRFGDESSSLNPLHAHGPVLQQQQRRQAQQAQQRQPQGQLQKQRPITNPMQQQQQQQRQRYEQPRRPQYQQPWQPTAPSRQQVKQHYQQRPVVQGQYNNRPAAGNRGAVYGPGNSGAINIGNVVSSAAIPPIPMARDLSMTPMAIAPEATANPHQATQHSRKRIRSVLFLAALAFLGMVVLDGLVQFTDLSQRVDKTVRDGVENAVNAADSFERKLVDELRPDQQQQYLQKKGGEDVGVAGRFLRRLADYLLDDEENGAAVVPPHRSYSDERMNAEEEGHGAVNREDANRVAGEESDNTFVSVPTSTYPPRTLHTLPLLPKHALQHRQRRELMDKRLPIPDHLQEGQEDEMYHAENAHRRRRMYPVLKDEEGGEVVDARMLQQEEDPAAQEDDAGDGVAESQKYETGALYQGYGTHYLDLWVGTPPQRQTVIIDTGSSITAFPCTGCNSCGSNPSTGKKYHLDEDFDTAASKSYEEKSCAKASGGCALGTCRWVTTHGQQHTSEHCQLAVSYAEGSSWTAFEGSDVVYPAGLHDKGLWTKEDRLAVGIGAGMGDVGEQKEFDWLDFRLKFGCQTRVTGLFRTQLEDGIMGMDNRRGAFWLQLRDHYNWHYQHNGYTPSEEDKALFDNTQFSLCYDRQPLSMDLEPGVGSGALTLGGTDSLLHNTPMVYAANITPKGGWYSVRVKAMFLRTNGGTLSEPLQDEQAMEYARVNAFEETFNGYKDTHQGVIVDSGTTDTYLPQNLIGSFNEAWQRVLGDESKYHNNLQELTPEQVKSMPTILLVLQGHSSNNNENSIGMTKSHQPMFDIEGVSAVSESDVVVAIPPSHYMEESHREPGKYTARIYFSERYGTQSILGSNFLMGHEVNFDVGGGRIGFAESHCDYSRYVKERDAKLHLEHQGQLQQEEGDVTSRVAQAEGNGINEDHNIEGDLAASGWARI